MRSSPISRRRWMTVSDIVLTNPTAEMTAEITTMAIITAVVVESRRCICSSSAGDRSHEPTDCCRARRPDENVVTRVTPTTRPIVERVVRSGSRTALRPATRATGPVPSSRLTMPDQPGDDEPGAHQEPGAGHDRAGERDDEPRRRLAVLTHESGQGEQTRPSAIISPASAARTTDVRRRRTGVTDDPDRAAAGVTRRIRRDPTHPATAYAGVMVTTGRTSSVLANGYATSGKAPRATSTTRKRSAVIGADRGADESADDAGQGGAADDGSSQGPAAGAQQSQEGDLREAAGEHRVDGVDDDDRADVHRDPDEDGGDHAQHRGHAAAGLVGHGDEERRWS